MKLIDKRSLWVCGIYVACGIAGGLLLPKLVNPSESEAIQNGPAKPRILAGKWISEGGRWSDWLHNLEQMQGGRADLDGLATQLMGCYFDQSLLRIALKHLQIPEETQIRFWSAFPDEPLLEAQISPEEALSHAVKLGDISASNRRVLFLILVARACDHDPAGTINYLAMRAPATIKAIAIQYAYEIWLHQANPSLVAKDLLARDLTTVFGNPSILQTVIARWAKESPLEALNYIENANQPDSLRDTMLISVISDLPDKGLGAEDYQRIFDNYLADGAPNSFQTGLSQNYMLRKFFSSVGKTDKVLGESLAKQIEDVAKRESALSALASPL